MKWTIFGLTLMCSIIMNGQNVSFQTISIEPHLGFQNYEHFKRLVLISKDGEAEHIKGFKFEWGFTYKLRVKVTELSPELSDGTKYDFELDKIISKTKVPESTTFNLFIDPHVYYKNSGVDEEDINKTLKLVNDRTYLYFDHVEIIIPKNLISAFNKIANGKLGKAGEFVYMSNNRIRLVRFK